MVEARERACRRPWLEKPGTASSTRSARSCRARTSSPARWRSNSSAQGGVRRSVRAHDRHPDVGDQRRARQRDVRARRRNRRLRAGHQGASRVRRRPCGAGRRRARRPSGMELIRAVALGYDVCCRFLMALGPDHVRGTHRSAEGTSATIGSVGGRGVVGAPGRAAGCATRSRMPRSRSRASGAGCATPSTSRRRSTSPAWARATA